MDNIEKLGSPTIAVLKSNLVNLRSDKEILDWLLTDYGQSWFYDQVDNGFDINREKIMRVMDIFKPTKHAPSK